jgi:hypothetical protein
MTQGQMTAATTTKTETRNTRTATKQVMVP